MGGPARSYLSPLSLTSSRRSQFSGHTSIHPRKTLLVVPGIGSYLNVFLCPNASDRPLHVPRPHTPFSPRFPPVCSSFLAVVFVGQTQESNLSSRTNLSCRINHKPFFSEQLSTIPKSRPPVLFASPSTSCWCIYFLSQVNVTGLAQPTRPYSALRGDF